jgi:hypothetical protein
LVNEFFRRMNAEIWAAKSVSHCMDADTFIFKDCRLRLALTSTFSQVENLGIVRIFGAALLLPLASWP